MLTCGRNDEGQCGLGLKHPIVLEGLEAIAQLRKKRSAQIPIEKARLAASPDAPTDPDELDAMAVQAAVR